jgi:hypothetical protein
MWYLFTSSLKDEETQKKGVVMVIFNVGKMAVKENLSFLKRVHKVREGIPKKIVGGHYCYNDSSLRPFVAGLRLFLDKEARRRFRPHYGSHEDIQFELQTYGIPTKDHPIQENGSLSLAWHREWLQVRQAQEASESTSDGIIVPRRFDVLFGRGKNAREHTGNLRASHLVEMHKVKYEKANKHEKTEIADRIVSIIHESCGRVLKWEDDGWSEVDHDGGREKISHFFRHLRSKKPTTTGSEEKADNAKPQAKRITPCPSPVHYDVDEGKPSKQNPGIN